MTWDYSILKKYNSTNHFRLLKQLKNDLKPEPQRKGVNEKLDKPDG